MLHNFSLEWTGNIMILIEFQSNLAFLRLNLFYRIVSRSEPRSFVNLATSDEFVWKRFFYFYFDKKVSEDIVSICVFLLFTSRLLYWKIREQEGYYFSDSRLQS